MAQRLGLGRRLVQKMLQAGAPDCTDQQGAQDWPQFEREWRGWITRSATYRSLAPGLRRPVDLDHTATTASADSARIVAAGGALPAPELDSLKARRCRLLDLEIAEKERALVSRAAAKAIVQQIISAALVRLNEMPSAIAARLPIEQRASVRAAGREVAEVERRRLETDLRAMWHKSFPRQES